MAIKFPDSTSAPKARGGPPANPARLRGFPPVPGVQGCTPQYMPRPGAILREQGGIQTPARPATGTPLHMERVSAKARPGLGIPLDIRQVAILIGCSPWTVRQTLIPRGLPHFRFTASGRLTFYEAQVIRWIEKQQGGKTTL